MYNDGNGRAGAAEGEIPMNYNYLVYFQTLARYEHYRKAAEALHITQPSLSKAMRSLEQELEVSLFERSGRGVRLTRQGQSYLEYVNRALGELMTGSDVLRYERSASAGVYLRLGVTVSTVWIDYRNWLRLFRERQQRPVFYYCRNGSPEELMTELKSGGLDLIICTPAADPKIEFTPVCPQQLMLLVPSSHRFAKRHSVHIKELNGESFIAHRRGSFVHRLLGEVYRENDIQVKIAGEADDEFAISAMVSAGIGCAVMLRGEPFAERGICAVPITGSGYTAQICVGRLAGARLPQAGQEFYDCLRSRYSLGV